MKQLLAITRPDLFPGEASLLTRLFDQGLARLHIRKPGAGRAALESLLRAIPPEFYPRIALHDHFGLAETYALGGVHLNSRNPASPPGWGGRVSRSCHSLEELTRYASLDYLFLSPLFPSISKEGYGPALSEKQLKTATELGIITEKVVALGGISADTLPRLRGLGFGGVAVLGALWGTAQVPDGEQVVKNFYTLYNIVNDIA